MSTLVVSRRQGGILSNPNGLPRNEFQIKEMNAPFFVVQFLKDHPLVIDFASELTAQNQTPTNTEITFDFGSITLTPAQEADAITAIEEYRDKTEFTVLDQLNIASQQIIADASEQVGDVFDSDNIEELILPDFCEMREQFKTLYIANGWSSFSVGEKRILIADWLVPTNDEVKEIFQGGKVRSEIYRLFAYRVNTLFGLELVKFVEDLAENEDGDIFDKILKRSIHPGSINLKNQVFISRSNSVSADATTGIVEAPIFGNVRTQSNFAEVLSPTELRITRSVEVDLSYSCTVTAPGNGNSQIGVLLINADIDGQGMKRDGRGRDTLDHVPIRIELSENDIIKVTLAKLNTAGTAQVAALSGKSAIRIDEVLS